MHLEDVLQQSTATSLVPLPAPLILLHRLDSGTRSNRCRAAYNGLLSGVNQSCTHTTGLGEKQSVSSGNEEPGSHLCHHMVPKAGRSSDTWQKLPTNTVTAEQSHNT